MHDPFDDILKRVKDETPYLADDGFSDLVMEKLPIRRSVRLGVIGGSWILAFIVGAVVWGISKSTVPLPHLEPLVLWSAVTLGFWALIGLFAYIAVEEGIIEV